MVKDISLEQQKRIDKGLSVVQKLAEEIRKMSGEEKAGAIRVMQLIEDNTSIGYRNICRPLKVALKEFV